MRQPSERYSQDESGQWWWRLANGGRMRARVKACEVCQREFVTIDAVARCCSRSCAQATKRVGLALRHCNGCGVAFKTKDKRQRFCGHACAAKAMHARKQITTPGATDDLVNRNNPLFSLDPGGQWWYAPTGHARTRAYIETCSMCGNRFLASIFHRRRGKDWKPHCSRRCGVRAAVKAGRKQRSGHLHHRWTGGKRVVRGGYVHVLAPNHPSLATSKRRYVFEHRLVMEQVLGRFLMPYEQVHHRNGIRDDNRPENLELWAHQQPSGQRVDEQHAKHCPTCTCHLHEVKS